MATERLSMHKAREILRQKLLLKRPHREIARGLGTSAGVVGSTLSRARAAGLVEWGQIEPLGEAELEQRLYGVCVGTGRGRAEPDYAQLHAERKRPGVTLELLHLEYLERHPDGYRYSQFCERYRRWLRVRGLTMRQEHRAGEKLFVDYSGKKPSYTDPVTGQRVEVELFVAVLGASSYTYAEATASQRSADFIASHTRALGYFGGAPQVLVPDQLRSGVSRPCRYEPLIQRTYQEMARHYGAAVVPARPLHPRDKAKVEVAVQVAQRWILARLRHQTFFSLQELNDRIAELLEDLNSRTMRVYRQSRRELFERLDRPALRPLPREPFVYAEWKAARVNIDYHVELEGHYYSVPHALVHQMLEIRSTALSVEVYHRGQRVAAHARSPHRGRHSTVAAHMPKQHQKHLEWTPSRMVSWARTIGPRTCALVEAILADRPHPEQGYRSCLGILRLAKRYNPQRLEAACARAVALGVRSFRPVDSILKNGLDQLPPLDAGEAASPPPAQPHPNVRGPRYYH